MGNDIINTNFKLPNRDGLAKTSGGIFKLLIIGVIGFAAYVYLLPFLIGIAIGTIEFFITATVALFLLWILTKPKFWRALNYYSQWIAEKLLNMAIEMNPFQILTNQVEQAERDREDIKKQADILRGQQSKLQNDVDTNDKLMKQSAQEIHIIQQKAGDPKIQVDSDRMDNLNLEMETSTNNYNNAKDYIESVKPILDSIDKLVTFADKAYRKSGNALANAKSTIRIQKDKYDAVTTGSRAMSKAEAAFTGRADLNQDAEKALEFLRKDIGNKIGSIKGAIQITSQIMDHKDLADAAKAQSAAANAESFNLDDKFKYSDTLTNTVSPLGIKASTSSSNDYIDFLKK
jgi:predicted nucleic-acid-binding protein